MVGHGGHYDQPADAALEGAEGEEPRVVNGLQTHEAPTTCGDRGGDVERSVSECDGRFLQPSMRYSRANQASAFSLRLSKSTTSRPGSPWIQGANTGLPQR